MGYADELLKELPSPPFEAKPQGYAQELFSGPGPKGAVGRPDVGDDPATAAGPGTTMRASLAPNSEDQIKRYAAARFPGLYKSDPAAALGRYGVVDGNIVYADEQGQLQREVPSLEKSSGLIDLATRFAPWLASQFGPSLPQAAATVTGAAMGPTPASIPAAAGAAGVTDVVRQIADRVLAGESATKIDWWNAAGQGVLGGAGQGVAVGVTRAFNRNPMGVGASDRMNAKDPVFQAEVARIQKLAKDDYGIDLSAGQATRLQSILVQERQAGKWAETTDRVADFTENQRRVQVPTAYRDKFLNRVAPDKGGEAAIQQFREGGQVVQDTALDARNMASGTAYKTALDDNTTRFWTPEVDFLMQRPSVKEGIAFAKKIAAEEGKDVTVPVFENGKLVGREFVPDWRSWDYIKRGVDAVIEANTNEFGRVNAYGRAVAQTKKELLKHLDAANPDYAKARAVYGSASDSISAILDGGVGSLNAMAGPDRQAMLTNVFGGRSLMPEEISRMRSQFVDVGRLEDWNQGLRQFLSGKLDQAMTFENTPQRLYRSLWQDPQQRRAVQAALGDKDLSDGFATFMEVLDRARRSLPEGSPTATDLPAMGAAASQGAKMIGKATSPQSYLNLGNEVVQTIVELRTPAMRAKLADALLRGDTAEQLKKLRMLSPTSEKAVALFSQILTNAGISGAEDLTGVGRAPERLPASRAATTGSPARP